MGRQELPTVMKPESQVKPHMRAAQDARPLAGTGQRVSQSPQCMGSLLRSAHVSPHAAPASQASASPASTSLVEASLGDASSIDPSRTGSEASALAALSMPDSVASMIDGEDEQWMARSARRADEQYVRMGSPLRTA
jgi:hypothetical protein